MAYFRQQIARHQQQEATGAIPVGSSRGTVIFDIDETALSNMDGFFGSTSWVRFLGGAATERCVRPHLEYANLEPLRLKVMGEAVEVVAVPAAQRKPLCNSPPLRATLDLYNFLYDNNYTVVFLTGRSDDGRSETEANLAAAGYGTKCIAAAADPAAAAAASYMASADTFGSSFRRTGRRQLLQLTTAAATSISASSDTADGVQDAKGSPFSGLFAPPATAPRCYQALLMRQVGDERLASVFKAEARSQLVAEGHVLVGNLGDQFSDLVGQSAAAANFKLPNPVYTLL